MPTNTPLSEEDRTELALLSEQIRDTDRLLDELRERRRTLIIRHIEQGVRREELARACGLSRQRLSKLMDRNAPPKFRVKKTRAKT